MAIQFTNLTVEFDKHFSVYDINWSVTDGEHWVIVGPNGAGKSALAAILTGEGIVQLGSVSGIPEKVEVVSFAVQAALINAERRKDDADLIDVVARPTAVRDILSISTEAGQTTAALIDGFQIRHLLDEGFRNLSSGETRKVLLVKALSSKADLLILDEPFEGLDKNSCEKLRVMLPEIAYGTQLVFVLNHFDEIPEFVTHVAYMDQQKLTHCLEYGDKTAMVSLRHLLHLKHPEIEMPPPDVAPRLPLIDEGEPLVRLRRAKVAYGDKIIFDQIDWTIEKGVHWQVTGPNGSGKTCLLNLITGDHPQCYTNDIRIFGMQRGTGESIWDIKKHIGYVSNALQWEYKVSVSVRNAIISGFFDSIGIYQQYTDVQGQIADCWLNLLGVSDLAHQPFNQLSFGDQRLILIARAMIKHPPLLILDEPCLGLDNLNRQMVIALIEKICSGTETTVLYVNHRPADHISGIQHHLEMGSYQ